MSAAAPPAIGFFFDFDGTISVSMYVERLQNHAVSDSARRYVVEALSAEEAVQNFGGPERLAQLKAFLDQLRSRGAKVYIISHGLAQVIAPHLAQVGLDGCFDAVYGSDTAELRACGGGHTDKARLIERLMQAQKLSKENCAFFEDTEANLTPATGVCGCYLVGRGGIDAAGMDAALKRYFTDE
tara:strand:+ start:331 stop:882 length:552 start_codon:yes stop_codon:yes gene_type:complete